ncbi:hypothetical protein SK128_022662 [Halocaridina rubra]|uniref:HAT C-terminal dimerisation domain-containing protein n=1 Tax=Halocaridina rubra TaxID=373956 RepID=A0AAN9A512_HALRR
MSDREIPSLAVKRLQEIRKRFPLGENNIPALLNILEPKVALFPERNLRFISKVAIQFPTLAKEEELDKLQEQWRDLLYANECLKHRDQSATYMWFDFNQVNDGLNQPKFDLLSKLMCGLLALPHSSASVKRIFFSDELNQN